MIFKTTFFVDQENIFILMKYASHIKILMVGSYFRDYRSVFLLCYEIIKSGIILVYKYSYLPKLDKLFSPYLFP